jgi:hypothetical protein
MKSAEGFTPRVPGKPFGVRAPSDEIARVDLEWPDVNQSNARTAGNYEDRVGIVFEDTKIIEVTRKTDMVLEVSADAVEVPDDVVAKPDFERVRAPTSYKEILIEATAEQIIPLVALEDVSISEAFEQISRIRPDHRVVAAHHVSEYPTPTHADVNVAGVVVEANQGGDALAEAKEGYLRSRATDDAFSTIVETRALDVERCVRTPW